MKIFVSYKKTDDKKSKTVIDANVVPDNELRRYARRAAELNKSQNSCLTHIIEDVPDDSLTAFMARNRLYDINMCQMLATSLYNNIEELRGKIDLFLRYCSEIMQSH